MKYLNLIPAFVLLMTARPSHSQPVDDYHVLWQCSGQTDTSEFGAYLVSAGDQNQDGFDDILITALKDYYGKVYLYYGGNPMDTIPDLVFGPPESHVNLPKECRDLNGDGYPDIAIGGANTGGTCVFLYFGGPNLSNQYDMLFRPGPPGSSTYNFGQYMSMGDINGDGNYDLVVGAPQWYQGGTSGKIFVYYGGADMDTTADFTITGTSATVRNLGSFLSCGGDVNNDGYDDIVAGGSEPGYSEGIALYLGGCQQDTLFDWIIQVPFGSFDDFGQNIIPDINNDECDEIIFGSVGGCNAYLYYGNENISSTYDVFLQGSNIVDFTQGANYIGDINNDGYGDYATGSYEEECIFIYFLSPNIGNAKNYDLLIQSEGIGSYAASYAGDINNDGVTEIMFRSHAQELDRGTVCIYGNPDLSVVKPAVPIPPAKFTLYPCSPNPFNSSTVISFELYASEKPCLKIYDCLGREIEDLGFGIWEVGVNKVVWNAKGFSSGTYFIELSDGAVKKTTAVQLIK